MFAPARLPDAIDRYLKHPLEAAAAGLAYLMFWLLPLDVASALGGWFGRALGPRLGISRRARTNLRRAFPGKSDAEIAALVRAMWDNLGRVAAEYPHLARLQVYDAGGRIVVVGAENVDALREDGEPGIFFSGHLGNWEIVSLAATQRGVPLDRIYRAANNRLVEWLYRRGRSAVEGALIPKGAAGAKGLLRSMRGGRHIGMLVDQKMNDGVAVPFFGIPAMTAPALAELALRYECPVVAARVERLNGARFRITIEKPLRFRPSGDRQRDVIVVMTEVNRIIEGWIRATPEQWLWLHNRWPD